jgi:integrating conjugative element protein (TIGR03757 family)
MRMTAHRRRSLHVPALVVGICAAMGAQVISASEVWVVTDSQHPVKVPPGVRVTELDAAHRIEARLARGLPPNPERAAAVATQRLRALTPELTQALAGAYQGIVDAWSMGVTKIPAVIVDRRYIVYGERDVERAVSEIERYRRTRR